MALLLLRHALSVTDSDAEDDPSTFFSVSDFSSLGISGSYSSCIAFKYIIGLTSSHGHSLQLFLLRAAGFLLPCYIMAWAISILQRRRQRQVSFSLGSD